MKALAWVLVLASLRPVPAPGSVETRLASLSHGVLDADYRGDRARLASFDADLARLPDGPLADYREYWRAFAWWRRAINGFNETPTPNDLGADLEKAVAHFKAALERRPDWIEAKLALVGCWGNQIYLAGKDEARRKAILEEAGPTFKWILAYEGDNPRVLWIRGGYELYAASQPPPKGGDYARPAVTFRRGLEGAWKEALASPAAPAYAPTWDGPESLMNLAYLYSHSPKTDRTAALAYAQGALVSVPQWHYVRDILLDQIEALPVAAAAAEAP